MKKLFFYFFVTAALCLFFLFSCGRTDSLYDIVLFATATEELPAGKILTYGKFYEDRLTEESLSNYLSLEGYPSFAEKIEEMAVFSTLGGEYIELCMIRLYRASDVGDAELFLERRIKAAEKALKASRVSGFADTARVESYGRTVVLYMTDQNEKYEKKIKSRIY